MDGINFRCRLLRLYLSELDINHSSSRVLIIIIIIIIMRYGRTAVAGNDYKMVDGLLVKLV